MMDAKMAMDILTDTIEEAKTQKIEAVAVSRLELYVRQIRRLAELSGQDLIREIEEYKAQNESELAGYKARNQ